MRKGKAEIGLKAEDRDGRPSEEDRLLGLSAIEELPRPEGQCAKSRAECCMIVADGVGLI